MAGYRAPLTVRTPWGNAGKLRERKLNPGLGTPREEVARNQRERLFGAMVASVATKGYRATSVADLVELSGVSRATFYVHFADKEACFVVTLEELISAGEALMVHSYRAKDGWEEGAQAALGAFVGVIAAQPAAARACLIEAYAAGAAALEPLGAAVNRLEAAIAAALEGVPRLRGTPRELIRALIGGMLWIVYYHLKDGSEGRLPDCVPELWEWAIAYEPPARSLHRRGRRAGGAAPSSDGDCPPFAGHVPSERILRGFAAAVTEKGYAETTIADIAARARISQATFYAHFKDKEDALLAAIESSGAQMMAATLPAVRRAKSWPEAVRTGLASIFAFLAAEPAFARMQAVEVYAAGPAAIEQRDRSVVEVVEVTLALALGRRPETETIAAEATVGAIGGLLYDVIRHEGPHALADYVPLATYVALTPVVGAARAFAVARG